MRQLQPRSEFSNPLTINQSYLPTAATEELVQNMREVYGEVVTAGIEVMEVTQNPPSIVRYEATTEETITPVKRKRTIKPKIIPDYWKTTYNGENAINSPLTIGAAPAERVDPRQLFLSPYSEFIPLLYLTTCRHSYFMRRGNYNYKNGLSHKVGRNLTEEIAKTVGENLKDVENIKGYYVWNHLLDGRTPSSIIGEFPHYLNGYLTLNTPSVFFPYQWIHSYSDLIEKSFKGLCTYLHMRSYTAYVGGYSLILQRDRNYITDITRPIVMPIILPENYIYQKLHLLVHGTIDMSKVVFLINKDIQNASFPIKSFRGMYKKYIEPIILETKAEIYYVPESFIKEYCFVSPFMLQETSLLGQKKEISGIINRFKENFLDKSGEDEYDALVRDEDEDDYSDEEMEDESEIGDEF